MARPRKQGLDYFPFDVDFFSDEKVVCIAGEYGLKGEITAIKLLCAIYRNGYFALWNETMKYKLLRELPGVSAELLDNIVSRLVRWGFFDKGLFDSTGVLTSRGIQRRYFEASKRRVPNGSLPYILGFCDKKPTETWVSATETGVSSAETPQSKEKESKEKKITHSDECVKKAAERAAAHAPTEKEISDFIREEGLDVDARRFFNYYSSVGWRIKGQPVLDWRPLARNWSSSEAQMRPKAGSGVRQPPRVPKTDMQLMAEADARHAAEKAAEAVQPPPVRPGEWKRKRGVHPDATILDIALGGGQGTETTTQTGQGDE